MSAERKQQLFAYLTEELERYRRGEINRFAKTEELADLFGYKGVTLASYLTINGLTRERRAAKLARVQTLLQPSSDYAWMLGVLAGGGHNCLSAGNIMLSRTDRFLAQAFESTGVRLFRLNASSTHFQKGTVYPYFLSRPISLEIGEMKRHTWPETIANKHAWINQRDYYRWSFLAGLFDARGRLNQSSSQDVLFPTTYMNVANYISNLLIFAGIEQPYIREYKRLNIIFGVAVYNQNDLRKLAENIHSVIPEKETILEQFRSFSLRKHQSPFSDAVVIEEWRWLREQLGHVPRSHEIDSWKKKGKTRFSAGVYINHFGNSQRERSFAKATAVLDSLTR